MLKRKILDENNTLIHTKHYPSSSSLNRNKKYKVLLGIGGNIGDVIRRFEHLYTYFNRSNILNILETAPILKNPPFGYLEQGDFYNSLLLVETNLRPEKLLVYILSVEKKFARKRLFKDGPRTLDIDMIFYENINTDSKSLTLPHPGWNKRTSVLIPLQYMKGRI